MVLATDMKQHFAIHSMFQVNDASVYTQRAWTDEDSLAGIVMT